MRYGVLGTGAVGQRLAGKLVELDHEVRMGGRSADNERGRGWASDAGGRASYGTFSDAAAFGETVLNCTAEPRRSTPCARPGPSTSRARC
jgi:8-hydroxy-5-deazaflavin:NADPH oxidoreductase